MDTKLLYFPSIDPPMNDWFKTGFLFYEQILTIAPPNFFSKETIEMSNKKRYLEYTDWLENKGYLKRISSFDNSMDRNSFDKKMRPTFKYIKENLPLFKDELKNGKNFKLLYGKFSNKLINRLDKMGLVIKDEIPNQWELDYIIPKSIGQVFMYQLAITLGELDYCTPSTDQQKYTFQFQEKNNPFLVEQKYMEIVMPQIFPIPLHLELEKLFEFKEKFSTELKNYRLNLENRLKKLEYVEKNKIDKYLEAEVIELKVEISRLEELYKDAGINTITYSDVINTVKVLKGVIKTNPFSAVKGLVGLLQRNKVPESKNPLTYPAMFNYQFEKNMSDNI